MIGRKSLILLALSVPFVAGAWTADTIYPMAHVEGYACSLGLGVPGYSGRAGGISYVIHTENPYKTALSMPLYCRFLHGMDQCSGCTMLDQDAFVNDPKYAGQGEKSAVARRTKELASKFKKEGFEEITIELYFSTGGLRIVHLYAPVNEITNERRVKASQGLKVLKEAALERIGH